MGSRDLKFVRKSLEEDPGSKWGFVVYRCTYDDDAAWERFMSHLNTRVRLSLEEDGDGDLFPRIDWNVQEHPSLNGASHTQVRKMFVQWVEKSSNREFWATTPRYLACIMVGTLDLRSVLRGPRPEIYDADGVGSVYLVSINEKEGYQLVGLSFVVPRIYSLLDGPGWGHIKQLTGM